MRSWKTGFEDVDWRINTCKEWYQLNNDNQQFMTSIKQDLKKKTSLEKENNDTRKEKQGELKLEGNTNIIS